jgi:hypothetical protein
MKTAFKRGLVVSEKPKGATEGFEARITWPSSVASSPGKISYLDENRLQYKRILDNRTFTLRLRKKDIKLKPLVKVKEDISQNQIIASVVPVSMNFKCKKDAGEHSYKTALGSGGLNVQIYQGKE